MGLSTKDLYLIGYNLACCAGWATILYTALPSVFEGLLTGFDTLPSSLAAVYALPNLEKILIYTQSAALLEIFHAALGLVRSPVLVTAMQVGSRIAALLSVTHSQQAQVQFGAGLMVLSWAFVEVPRYLFYVVAIITGDATKKTPYPLFWLRYSLFAVLYPTGITGELTVFLAAAAETESTALYYLLMSFPVIYAPGSPVMIMNMVGNRKSAFKKRFAKPAPPPRGIVWPVTGSKKGQEVRSSTPTAKEIVAAAVGASDTAKAEKCLKERNWRFGYLKHLIGLVEEQCKSPDSALKVANAGMEKAYDTFQFVEADGSTVTLRQAMSKPAAEQFSTGFVQGLASAPSKVLEVPYKGKTLSGEALKSQVRKWVEYGTIEQSAGDAIIACSDNPSYLDLSKHHFVLLGAGSAMGPLLVLMALGANVVAIDLDRPNIWKRLIGIARKSPGTLTFPMRKEQKDCLDDDDLYANSGCNLFTQTPMIRDWLLDLYPKSKFTVGSYAYLNGALHVQVSLAMDAITRDLTEKRKRPSLAYLCTPTDCHLIPKAAHDAAVENYGSFSKKAYCIVMRLLGRGKLLRKNFRDPIEGQGGPFYLVNGVSIAQGPNYILAKRIQHWRAIIARSKGCTVSSNIAPSTSTASVVQNRTFAWAYEGMPYFTPYEIFAPETSNSVMSAILFSDLSDPKSGGNPKTKLANPNQLFSSGGFHGGTWRCAYEVDSIGEASVFLYFGRVAFPYVAGVAAVGAAFVAKAYMG